MKKKKIDHIWDEDLGEKCGIFGVFGEGEEAARLTFFGLYALQHRGQEASGISSSDGKNIHTYEGLGLITHVYSEEILSKLVGGSAIGHNRYSTSGGAEHIQPVCFDPSLSLVHNGNLPSVVKLREFLSDKKVDIEGRNDSELIYTAIKYFIDQGESVGESIKKSWKYLTGAFSCIVLTRDKLVAFRDECGIRPLSLAKLNGGYVVSSETCAFDTITAEFLRDVNPGEMVVIDKSGLKSEQVVPARPKLDLFEFVYFARPDSRLLGKSVYMARRNMGKYLALEHPLDIDFVIPIPESGIPAAIGYSEKSGIPFEHALVKNRYIGRTFIMPDQRLREQGVKMKLNPIPEILKGKKVAIVDDSIVRATTSKKIVQILKDAGAKEVHLLVSSPPVKYPDFYGINTPTQQELIASYMSIEEIRKLIGADSLNFLSLENLIKATELPESVFSTSLFTGIYPIDIAERAREINKVS